MKQPSSRGLIRLFKQQKILLAYIWKILLFFILLVAAFFLIGWPKTYGGKTYGITWSAQYATFLGLDTLEGLRATLDDLGVRHFRIPVYWSEVEPTAGHYEWQSLERQLDLIASKNGKVTLSLGAKQPRWPEVWIPEWAMRLPVPEREQAQLAYVRHAFAAFDSHPAVEGWQVENEPSFYTSFGVGNPPSKDFIIREMTMVRELERQFATVNKTQPRLVSTTESGELSSWTGFASHVDAIGFSVYRVVYHQFFGDWKYWFIPPWYYNRKALLLKPCIEHAYVSEFQMEPWFHEGTAVTVAADSQTNMFGLQQMQSNFVYATRMDFSRIDFWGAEWWYFMKERGQHPEYWELAKTFFQKK